MPQIKLAKRALISYINLASIGLVALVRLEPSPSKTNNLIKTLKFLKGLVFQMKA
jgi:hypothetical protein